MGGTLVTGNILPEGIVEPQSFSSSLFQDVTASLHTCSIIIYHDMMQLRGPSLNFELNKPLFFLSSLQYLIIVIKR